LSSSKRQNRKRERRKREGGGREGNAAQMFEKKKGGVEFTRSFDNPGGKKRANRLSGWGKRERPSLLILKGEEKKKEGGEHRKGHL